MSTKKSVTTHTAKPPVKTSAAKQPAVLLTPEAPAFPIVGIGASAGGLAAFEAFFSGMPAGRDPGMAFVLVQHLAPDHKSMLAELVRRCTRMEVFEVEDGMPVQINCVYTIPPNHDMALINGSLQLLEPSAPHGLRLPVDFFFTSLARDQRERAIGIVLSGAGSDGASGARAIKDAGGMVMAQAPHCAEFDGMPTSAISTGVVDFTLPPADMVAKLMAYTSHAFGEFPRLTTPPTPRDENALKKVFVLLRAHTGHDFSGYKSGTVHRRIERRMAVHQVPDAESYVKLLQQTPAEVEALFRDLLIGVTHFFRDPDAFKVIEEQAIAQLFADKPAGSLVRVWVAGCSTGEEAYSIAFLLQECMEALKTCYTVQVFATDLDQRAIAIARAGIYPNSIAADLTPERLARFFTPEPGGVGYRIHKSIRDMLVFSEQDLIKDPPFSKLDFISCRNVLIYLGPELQQRLIPLFHYALLPKGLLFLGSSEGIGDFNDLFSTLERKAKLYQRRESLHGFKRAVLARALQTMPNVTALGSTPSTQALLSTKSAVSTKPALRELTEQALLQQFAVVAALVNAQGDILYLHGRSGQYLELNPGEAGVLNILKLARDGLRAALPMALHKCAATQESVLVPHLQVKTNDHFTAVSLGIHPVPASRPADATTVDAPLYLVTLQAAREPASTTAAATTPVSLPDAGVAANDLEAQALAQVALLKDELRAKDEYLQSTREELESSNEELKSSNEEMQSVNEELQSTNEELETSKEELQSVNEELATVNTELHTKVADMSRLNNDMNNLLAGTGIATVFVDPFMRILRFTPTAARIINLIASDVGRPVGHLVSNLVGYDQLAADAKGVLDTLVPKDALVQTTNAAWFTMRIRPYRTLDNMIEGVVITFVDVTDMKRVEQELEKANAQLRLAAGAAATPVPQAVTKRKPRPKPESPK